MKKLSMILGLLFMVAAACSAQEVPKQEVYLGYSFMRVNAATRVPAFTANGGLGAIQYNFNEYFSGVAEFGGYHNGNVSGVQLDSTLMSYLFGPRLTLNKTGVTSVFVHGLFGGTHYTRSIFVGPTVNALGAVDTTSQRAEGSKDAFSMAWGGGVDIRLHHNVALRPIQLDYYMTRFQPIFINGLGDLNGNNNQHNLRYSAGLAFRF